MNERSPTTERIAHTQGPWWVDNRRPTGALQVQAQHRGVGSSYCVASVNYYEDDAANACLIAAAPELLDALKKVVALSDRKHDAWDAAHAAIAKAEGRS